MSTTATSQNIKAGLFVLVGAALAITSIFLLSNIWTIMFGGQITSYTVTYPVSEGVGFLAAGSDVRIGGIKTGAVTSVQLEVQDKLLDQIAVQFSLPADIAIYSNATVLVRNGLIGQSSSLDIVSVGWDVATGRASATGPVGQRVAANGRFAGTVTGGLLGSLLGPGATQSTSDILANLASITARLRHDGALLPWAIGEASAQQATAGLTDLNASLRSARTTLEALESRWPLWSSAVGTTLANLDLTGQQLNLMVQELRNSPWRLLYRPTADEAQSEMLYEASRNFVFGAADLRSAVQSLDRLVEQHGADAQQLEAYALLQKNLDAASKRYSRAEQQLNQVLQQQPTPAAGQ